MSHDRRRFPWRLAPGALTMQVALVLLLCGFPPAQGVL
jgi:nucleoside permease NupC